MTVKVRPLEATMACAHGHAHVRSASRGRRGGRGPREMSLMACIMRESYGSPRLTITWLVWHQMQTRMIENLAISILTNGSEMFQAAITPDMRRL